VCAVLHTGCCCLVCPQSADPDWEAALRSDPADLAQDQAAGAADLAQDQVSGPADLAQDQVSDDLAQDQAAGAADLAQGQVSGPQGGSKEGKKARLPLTHYSVVHKVSGVSAAQVDCWGGGGLGGEGGGLWRWEQCVDG
jgi:hypothetical protein